MLAGMIRRLFLVGTDTSVGKTAVASALLRQARAEGLRVLPFKPASSGGDDPERLLAAAALDPKLLPRMAPLRYEAPLAPGIAEDPGPFIDPLKTYNAHSGDLQPGVEQLSRITADLRTLERDLRAEFTIIEGAGGLHVPMPGATWLPQWIDAFAAPVVIVGRLGLGTINHTVLTAEALDRSGHRAIGFLLSATDPEDDPSTEHNPQIIAQRSGLPCLGLLAHGATSIELRAGAWSRLLGRTNSQSN
ncbi:MAG TPA: dethiobiotin synthase [Nannocystis exedens]|nr:dethiobiotin synthase [Nannocystis exedens]